MKNNFNTTIFLLLFLLVSNTFYAQNLEVLKEDRGYKEIRLGNDISQYNCFKQEGRPHGAQSLALAVGGKDQSKIMVYNFLPNSDYPYYKIGDVEIYKLEVMTYNQKIYEIKIYLAPHVDILPILKYRFGDYTNYDEMIFPTYKWKTNNGIVCELLGYGGDDYIKTYILKYTDEKITDLMEQEAENQKEFDRLKKERKLKDQAKSGF